MIEDLEALRDADRFRFANRLAAWIEVEDGRIVDAGLRAAAALIGRDDGAAREQGPRHARGRSRSPTSQEPPEITDTEVRFVQTAGGRTGAAGAAAGEPPAVRAVQRADRVDDARAHDPRRRHVDVRGGGREHVPPPLDLRRRRRAHGQGRPHRLQGLVAPLVREAHAVGRRDSPAYVTAVESALERQLSTTIMRGGAKPEIRTVKEGKALVEQGARGHRPVPPPQRRASSVRGRRRAGGRARPRRRPRRAGGPRGRAPHLHRARDDRRARSRSPRADQIDREHLVELQRRRGPPPRGRCATRGLTQAASVRLVRIATWNVNSLKARLPARRGVARVRRARRAVPPGDEARRQGVPRD